MVNRTDKTLKKRKKNTKKHDEEVPLSHNLHIHQTWATIKEKRTHR